MVKVELFLFFILMWIANAKVFHHNRHRIMTPTTGQTGNPLPWQGNINENAMLPLLNRNGLASDIIPQTTNNEEETTTISIVPITSDITSTHTSVESATTPPTIIETVASVGGTVIRLEFPSSITIFVNITNGGQPTSSVSNIGATIEIPTLDSTVGTSTVHSGPTEMSTVSTTVDISTEMGTNESSNSDRSIGLTTADSTSEISTTEVNTVTPGVTIPVESSTVGIATVESTDENSSTNNTDETSTYTETSISESTSEISASDRTVEISTVDNTIRISTADTTMEISTADSNVEGLTPDSTVEMSVTANTVEMSTVENAVEVSTVENTVGMTTEEVTVEMLTADSVDMSTVESTIGISTAATTVELSMTEDAVQVSTVDTTVEMATTENTPEMSTIEIAVEIITENSTESESNSLTSPTVSESTDSMTHIQININLSDNTQNVNFGSTTQPSTSNLGQLQNKMIHKEKCEEYYIRSRAVRTAKVQVFIVGGTNSMPKEFPHMAALGYGNGSKTEWLCGGSLISENYVITAAHCVSSKILGEVQVVRLGTTILPTETLDSEDYKVIRRIIQPAYNNEEQYNDIALLQLDRTVTFSEYISPICLFSSNLTEGALIATGWGKTEPTGDVSPELQKVELEYFPNKECQDSYSVVSKEDLPKGIMEETQICAGSRSEEKDTCQGDSGGPLQIQDDGKMYIVGITSFGIGCGKPGRPGVYTRVSYYIPWIEQIVWGNGR